MAWAPGAAAQHGDPTTTVRLGSDDADATAIAISRARFADGEAASAVVSRNDVFADALAGAPLTDEGPLLFTPSQGLSEVVGDELERVLPAGSTVFLLGGDAALSPAVASGVEERGFAVRRLSGPSRVETAIAIADEVRRRHPDNHEVAVARAHGTDDNPTAAWADAVTGGAWAAATGTPILITPTEGVVPEVTAWLADDDPSRIVVLGGAAAVSLAALETLGDGAQRVSGEGRAETAAAVATELWPSADLQRSHVVVNGSHADGWRYGLAGAGLAADLRAPVLLAAGWGQVPDATLELLRSSGDAAEVELTVLGGQQQMPDARVQEMDAVDGGARPVVELAQEVGTYTGRPDTAVFTGRSPPATLSRFDDRGSEFAVTVDADGHVEVRVWLSVKAPSCGDGQDQRTQPDLRQAFVDLGLEEQLAWLDECSEPRMVETWTGSGQWTGPGDTLLVGLEGVRILNEPVRDDPAPGEVATTPSPIRLDFDGTGIVTATGELVGERFDLVAHLDGPPVLDRCVVTGPITRHLAHGFGAIWATTSDRGIWRIDDRTMTPTLIARRGDHYLDIVAGPEAVWASSNTGDVLRIDPESNAVEATAVGGVPDGLQIVDGGLWMAGTAERQVTRVDLASRAVEHVPLPGAAAVPLETVVVHDIWYWVPTDVGIARVDTPNRAAILTPLDGGVHPSGLLPHPVTQSVSVAHERVGHVSNVGFAGGVRWTYRVHDEAVGDGHGGFVPLYLAAADDGVIVHDNRGVGEGADVVLSTSWQFRELRRPDPDELAGTRFDDWTLRLEVVDGIDVLVPRANGTDVDQPAFRYDRRWTLKTLQAAGALWWSDQLGDGAVCRAVPA